MAKKLLEVVEGDFRYGENEADTQHWLLKIPPIRKRTPEGSKVRFEDVEDLIIQLTKKYGIKIQWINLSILKDEIPWYSATIMNEQHERVKTIYGLTMYELYAKAALFMFATTRKKG